MINGLDLLFLEVNSLEESVAFYQGVLGMEIESVNYDSEPPMARLRSGDLRITLAQHLETMLRRGRGVHFFLGVEDVDLFY
jgi:catechol 2,3-dioxygenase-like lactoylglutathione lyase family enzyme